MMTTVGWPVVVVFVSRITPPPATLPEVVVVWFGLFGPSMRARQSALSFGATRVAALDRVLAQRAGVVEAVALALVLGGAGFLQAGRAVFGGAAGLAVGALLQVGRLGGRGRCIGGTGRRRGEAGGDADDDQAGKRCKIQFHGLSPMRGGAAPSSRRRTSNPHLTAAPRRHGRRTAPRTARRPSSRRRRAVAPRGAAPAMGGRSRRRCVEDNGRNDRRQLRRVRAPFCRIRLRPAPPLPPIAAPARGFSLIELMVVVAIIVILALIALPNIPDKLIRDRIVEAVKLADIVKPPIAASWATPATLPVDNAAAGLPPPTRSSASTSARWRSSRARSRSPSATAPTPRFTARC